MNEATALKLENQNPFIDELHLYIATYFPEGMILFSQITAKVLIVLGVFFLLDIFQREVLLKIVKMLVPKTKNIWMNTFMEKDVFTSFFHLFPLGICYLLVPLIFYHHPHSFHILDLVFSVFLIIFLTKFFINVIDAYTDIKNRDISYRTVALKTFSELLKISIIVFSGFVIASVLFNLTSSKVFTFLGAIMAMILLVFRDPILGFVASINIASSKQIKIGDLISVSKYGVEGNVKDINLVTTKIQNTDKTISSIPTYDLVSTEVKNHEPMRTSNTRRVKRSLIFNFKSFRFVDEELFTTLMGIEILQHYLEKKLNEINESTKGELKYLEIPGNKYHFTNIGIYRHYAQIYLERNPFISKKDTLMVRQLESTIYGLPIEVYCFTNTSNWKEYEEIQADIFEHLIATAVIFQLEISLATPS